MLDYLHAHPDLSTVLAGFLAGLLPSVVALLVGRWQSRSAVEAKRLELRHEMSKRWLAEFSTAATQYQECLNKLRSSLLDKPLSMEEAHDANAAFQKSVEDLMDICAVIIFSFPRHWLAGALSDCVLGLHGVSGLATQRLSQGLRGAIKAEEERALRNSSDLDAAAVLAVPQPLLSPEEVTALSLNFDMLRSLANSAIEARLMQNQFALRRWHLRADLRSMKKLADRLKASAVPDE